MKNHEPIVKCCYWKLKSIILLILQHVTYAVEYGKCHIYKMLCYLPECLSFQIIHVFYAFEKSIKLSIFVYCNTQMNTQKIQKLVTLCTIISFLVWVSHVINHIIIGFSKRAIVWMMHEYINNMRIKHFYKSKQMLIIFVAVCRYLQLFE